MDRYIAYCGLDCKTCEARIATVNDDDMMRRKVAEEWSKLNHAEITPEMISCTGCRIEGVKTPFCEMMCPVRQCASGRNLETCGSCSELASCEKLAMITGNNPSALQNLKNGR